MKQTVILFLSFVFVMFAAAPQTAALEISLDKNGVARFYQDSVLGRNSETNARGTTIRQKSDTEAIREVAPRENKELLFRSTDRGVDVELRNRDTDHQNTVRTTENADEEVKYRQSEKIETDRLRVEFSAAPKHTDVDKEARANQQGDTAANREAAIAAEKAEMEARRSAMEADKEARREEYKAQLENTMQERRDRLEETAAIVKEKHEGSKERLELVSRDVKARLQEGADFVLDPKTNTVRVNTPSGNSHEITHLPDQAIARMQEAGVIKGDHDFGTFPVEIVERPDGEVAYKTQSTQTRRLFGLFDREVPIEAHLNDKTGEVEATTVRRSSAIGRFLDMMSL